MGGRPLRRRRSRVLRRTPVVLLYHGFCDTQRPDDPESLFVTGTNFAAQLDHLLEARWRALNLSEYLEALDWPRRYRRSFLVTIDDGLASVGAIAAPILEARGIPAVLFVPAGLLGSTAEWLPAPRDELILSVADLQHLATTTGIEMAGHGWRHAQMVNLTAEQLAEETTAVKDSLKPLIQRPVRAFAYPFGDHDKAAVQAVEDAGYAAGFSVHRDLGRFAISRVDVNARDNSWTFRLKVIPWYRVWWRMLDHVPFMRRLANVILAGRRDLRRLPRG